MLNYTKGSDVLPEYLLKEIQKYIDGGLVYIPKKGSKAMWGSKSGARKLIDERNKQIITKYEMGESIQTLADMYNLEFDTIRKIIYKKHSRK